jgi:hypothetical protein
MKYIITENQMMKSQFAYLDYVFKDMYKSEEYTNSKVWVKDGEMILQLEKSGWLWIERQIWNNIRDMFSIEYLGIKELMKEWGDENLVLDGITLHPNKINPFIFNPN